MNLQQLSECAAKFGLQIEQISETQSSDARNLLVPTPPFSIDLSRLTGTETQAVDAEIQSPGLDTQISSAENDSCTIVNQVIPETQINDSDATTSLTPHILEENGQQQHQEDDQDQEGQDFESYIEHPYNLGIDFAFHDNENVEVEQQDKVKEDDRGASVKGQDIEKKKNHHVGPMVIKRIKNKQARQQSCSKRKGTLLRKAKEFHVTSGSKVSVEILTESGEKYCYHSHPKTNRHCWVQVGKPTLSPKKCVTRSIANTPKRYKECRLHPL